MAAVDTFENFISTLSMVDKEKLRDFIKDRRAEMFTARSEDARARMAHEVIKEVHELLKKK